MRGQNLTKARRTTPACSLAIGLRNSAARGEDCDIYDPDAPAEAPNNRAASGAHRNRQRGCGDHERVPHRRNDALPIAACRKQPPGRKEIGARNDRRNHQRLQKSTTGGNAMLADMNQQTSKTPTKTTMHVCRCMCTCTCVCICVCI